MATINLKTCPFCGGDGEVANATAYLDRAKIVRCKRCSCRTVLVLIDHPKLTADGLDESTRYTATGAEKLGRVRKAKPHRHQIDFVAIWTSGCRIARATVND